MDIKSYLKSGLENWRKQLRDRSTQKVIAKRLALGYKIDNYRLKRAPTGVYVAIFVLLIGLVIANYLPALSAAKIEAESAKQSDFLASVSDAPADLSLSSDIAIIDKVVATNLAADLAVTANLPVVNEVTSLSISTAIEADSIQKAESVVTKPEIISLGSAKQGVKLYIVQEGDSLESIAEAHGISVQTVKWANDIATNSVRIGEELKILPVDGVYYQVKADDSLEKIVEKYKTNAGRVVAINDLEVSGLVSGTMIILPDAELPITERPGYVAPRRITTISNQGFFSAFGGGGRFNIQSWPNNLTKTAGNRYAWGNCTWYAYERRLQLGRPVGPMWGNAVSWAMAAANNNYAVNKIPAPGAVFQNGGGYGHVGVVEAVNDDGSIVVTEMNYAGLNIISRSIIKAEFVANYNYIH